MLFASCGDFLDETPNKSGSAYIYHIDQLYGLTGSLDLYLFQSPGYVQYGLVGTYQSELQILSDAVEHDPNFYARALKGGNADSYSQYKWEGEQFLDQYAMTPTWTPAWERISRFNTVLEHIDQVVQTTEAIRNQVEGEARFGRAYYHFLLLTQYCLWDENAPGIGYRDNSRSGEIPERQTVAYTLERIYEDLSIAETALTKAGRTAFDLASNFRPTVPTVQALRARIDLYRGNYTSALDNATRALEAHHALETFKDDPRYKLTPNGELYLLDETDSRVKDTLRYMVMQTLSGLEVVSVSGYEELFLPSVTSGVNMGMSDWFYNLWDRENDARWIYFYNSLAPLQNAYGILNTVTIDGKATPNCIKYADQQWLKPSSCHSYQRFADGNGFSMICLGMTTAEMYLIQAECLARSNQNAEAAEVLKTLRRTRFLTVAAAENIGGTLQEVLDERCREMGAFWRFFDIKRLNGAENAGISVKRQILSNLLDPNSVTELEIKADDPRWALPFCTEEAERMGWAQNPGWE